MAKFIVNDKGFDSNSPSFEGCRSCRNCKYFQTNDDFSYLKCDADLSRILNRWNLDKNLTCRDFKSRTESEAKDSYPGVFIAARKMVNMGKISSKGPGARTEIITEDYKGTGVVKAETNEGTKAAKEKWHQTVLGKIIIGVIITVFGGIILALIF